MSSSTTLDLLGSIPAPPGNTLSLGPLTFNYYGLMIALGVLVAVEIVRRRWVARGGEADDITSIATVGVPAGLVGARLYHVITDWPTYFGSDSALAPIDALKIWNGGLGIPGGLLMGLSAGAWQAHRRGITGDRFWSFSDAVIPGVPVAQAIGRLGNWFNQEIFGGPSTLPWAVEVDRAFRPPEYAEFATFHPAFLYEGLLNLALAGGLVLLDRTGSLKRGQIFPLWITGYGTLRFLIETLRTDPANEILGIRVNHWISGLAVIIGLAWFWWMQGRPAPAAAVDSSDLDLSDVDDDSDVDPSEVNS